METVYSMVTLSKKMLSLIDYVIYISIHMKFWKRETFEVANLFVFSRELVGRKYDQLKLGGLSGDEIIFY